jgi:FecR protein
MEREQIELWDKYNAGTLTLEEDRRLAQLLREDAAFLTFAVHDAEMMALLSTVNCDAQGMVRGMRERLHNKPINNKLAHTFRHNMTPSGRLLTRRKNKSLPWGTILAAGFAAGILMWSLVMLTPNQHNKTPVVAITQQPQPGPMKAGPMQAAPIILDRAAITTSPQTVVRQRSARELELIVGSVTCRVQKTEQPFIVESKHGRVKVVGTQFTFDVSPTKAAVNVSEGTVHFSPQNRQDIAVTAQQSLIAEDQQVRFKAEQKIPIVIVTSGGEIDAQTELVRNYLLRNEWQVTVHPHSESEVAQTPVRQLLIILRTEHLVLSERLIEKWGPRPILSFDPFSNDSIEIGSQRDGNYHDRTGGKIRVNAIPPLFAGIIGGWRGELEAQASDDLLGWVEPAPHTTVIAVSAAHPQQAVIACSLPNQQIGARIFVGINPSKNTTPAGWRIIDNAINWAVSVSGEKGRPAP